MKKYLPIALLILFSVVFSSCQSKVVNPLMEITGLSMVSNDFFFSSSYPGNNGFYESIPLENNDSTIIYIDYETKLQVYLCNRADCAHNDEACTAWVPSQGNGLFMNADKTKLFLMQGRIYDYSTNAFLSWDTLYVMNPDGTGREKVYEFSTDEDMYNLIASDENHLYFRVDVTDTQNHKTYIEIRRLDLATYKLDTIYSSEDFYIFAAAYDHYLVFYAASQNEENSNKYDHVIQQLDLTTHEVENVFYHPQQLEGTTHITYLYCQDQFVYFIEPIGNNKGRLIKYDLATRSNEILTEDLLYNQNTPDDTFQILNCIDNHLFILTNDTTGGADNIVFYRYAVDCDTGESKEITTKISMYSENDLFLWIWDVVDDDYYLVTYQYRIVDRMGVSFQIPSYALIKKEDFWANNPNYIPIENLTDIR